MLTGLDLFTCEQEYMKISERFTYEKIPSLEAKVRVWLPVGFALGADRDVIWRLKAYIKIGHYKGHRDSFMKPHGTVVPTIGIDPGKSCGEKVIIKRSSVVAKSLLNRLQLGDPPCPWESLYLHCRYSRVELGVGSLLETNRTTKECFIAVLSSLATVVCTTCIGAFLCLLERLVQKLSD